jgi:hypothetical protein
MVQSSKVQGSTSEISGVQSDETLLDDFDIRLD